ncbi:MAG: ATP-binding protein, partial [Bacteroidales bacterium]
PEIFEGFQDEARFHKGEGDSAKTAFLKTCKRGARGIYKMLISVFNVPRKLVGLKPVSSQWKQKVPLRNLVYTHLVLNNVGTQNEALQAFYSSLSKTFVKLWESDAKINQMIEELLNPDLDIQKFKSQLEEHTKTQDHESVFKNLTMANESFSASIRNKNSEAKEAVKKYCLLTGTFERKGSFYSNDRLESYKKSSTKQLLKTESQWYKTFFVLADDWKLDLEIYSLACLVYKDYYDFSTTISSRLTIKLREKMTELIMIVNNSQERFEKFKADKEADLIEDFSRLKADTKQKFLNELVPSIRELIIQSDIPAFIDSMEKIIRQQFEQLSQKRLLVKSAEYHKPVNSSDIESISPYLLVTFEMQPRFMRSFPFLKSSFITFINKVQNEIEEIPEILDFSLDSSISYFETHKNKEESLKISLEGFERSAKKANEINNKINLFIDDERQKFRESIARLIVDLIEVTNNENALQIKFRITKAKAIEKAKAIRTNIQNRIKRLLPLVAVKAKKIIYFLKFSSKKIKEQFDISEQKDFISTEISDYLSETRTAVDKLPFVYQRLFKIEALRSFEFYVEREKPLMDLKRAYDKWREGKFAPVVIFGEKGSGKTTLVNHFQDLNEINEEVLNIHLLQKPHNPEALFHELSTAVDGFSKSEREAAAQVNKKIVIVDGLERLFFAMVDGFEFMKKTYQLMSDTHQNIFWIFTCHRYSWDYINRCISAADYFAYHISLSDISDKNLKSIILKRNSVSGYKLVFNPGLQEKKLMFTSHKREQSQEELEKEYFVHLNQITGGNIAIALQYWMRSTAKVTDDTIYIKSLRDINLRFIQSISKTKLITIRSILIHNGLSIADYAKLFRISHENSSHVLDQLLNDGILTKQGDVFYINLLIYSQLVAHMKKLNLLA